MSTAGISVLASVAAASPFGSATSLSQLLALDSATRLYDIQIDGLSLATTPLQLEAFAGEEALSALYHFDLLLLSTNAQISLGSLIGRQARLVTRLSDGSGFPAHGLHQPGRAPRCRWLPVALPHPSRSLAVAGNTTL